MRAALVVAVALSSWGWLGGCDDGGAGDTGPPVSWTAEVHPVLDNYCTRCHPEYDGCTSVAPAPIASEVLRTARDGSMPPDGSDLLAAEEIELLQRWVAQGTPCD